MESIHIDAQWVDYAIIGLYFVFVLGVGVFTKRGSSDSIEFFLSGRSLPAWVTGLAFISANLGAVEVMGMSATGAEYGFPTMHYFWVGAVPAMLFLGIVMMPFYYGSEVRSVPEFMRMRFGTGAHLVNALSFAAAQLLIAGVNLSLLALIMNRLLGWPFWAGLVVAALFVLFYISVGGLTAAIYNEVLQFFVIIAALLPLTIVGLHRVGGWSGLTEKVANDGMLGAEQLTTWPGTQLSGFQHPVLSVIGIVFGLGFVLSFGYWTTNFVEVQRAMASKDMTAARMTPIIGAFPKMLVPFIVIVPGMIAAILVTDLTEFKQLMYSGDTAGAAATGVSYNDAILLLMRDVLPNGLLGVAIAGLLAAFMAGMAANVSSFNTVLTYDLYQQYINRDAPDAHYTRMGRVATLIASVVAIFTALIAASFSNILDYLQTLFGFFNAPLFATFILGMFWKRMTPAAGWSGLVAGTVSAIGLWSASTFGGLFDLGSGQGLAFVCAATAFIVDVIVSVIVTMFTESRPAHELKGLVYSETPKEDLVDPGAAQLPFYRRPVPMALIALVLVVALNTVFA